MLKMSSTLPRSQYPHVYPFRGRDAVKWLGFVKTATSTSHLGVFLTEAKAAEAVETKLRSVEKRKRQRRADVPQSRFKGVYFVLGGRWEAKITHKSKSQHIGTYDTEEEAARAFDAKARQLGVPKRCNFDLRGNALARGVRRSRNKWRAVISVDGQSVNLGLFDTKDEASRICRAAEAKNNERYQRSCWPQDFEYYQSNYYQPYHYYPPYYPPTN